MGYLIDVTVNDDGSVTKEKVGGTLEDASAVKMANGETTQKAITDLQARDINTFGTSDRWNGGSYTKGQYTIYQDTLYECIVNNNNVVPTNTTYWKKVSLAELSRDLSEKVNYPTSRFVATFATNKVYGKYSAPCFVSTKKIPTINYIYLYEGTNYTDIASSCEIGDYNTDCFTIRSSLDSAAGKAVVVNLNY